MNIGKLFNLDYLFNAYPDAGFSVTMRIVLYGAFALALLLAIIAGLRKKNNITARKKLWARLQTWGWSLALVGLLLAYFREVRAIYISSRIYLFVWLLICLIWLLFIIKYWKFDLPKKEKTAQSEAEFNKWLPKKK